MVLSKAPSALFRNIARATVVIGLPLFFGNGACHAQVGQPLPDLTSTQAPSGAIWLDSLDLHKVTQEYGDPHAGHSVDNNPITLKGTAYAHGLGTHARSEMYIDLKRAATRFVAMVGVDDERNHSGSVAFQVWVDGKKVTETSVLHGGDAPTPISVDLKNARRLLLVVTDGGDGIENDHGDWAGAILYLKPDAKAQPETLEPPVSLVKMEPPRMRFMAPGSRPAIHGPRITGATPGHAFLFRIAVTGQGPFTFAAQNLPAGITLDSQKGILSGALQQEGTTVAHLTVRGPRGMAKRDLTIVGGANKLALTPPMGWNSWNVWAGAVDAAKVRAAADDMIKSGLASHGFQYVNIDDTWEADRDAAGNIQTNAKFGDMKALADYVHSTGLKLGIYSSPGPKTCAGFTASYQHEQQDANSYAQWGIDYLKYDWCSYGDIAKGNSLEELEKPYKVMQQALNSCGRDIVYSLCQYGMGDVWEWGNDVGGNCWRTTGDINDSWNSLHDIYTRQNGHEKFAGPGHWNDPDMLIVGRVGWGNPHPTRLTPNEQLLHISMWCLLSSPLLIGCDMSQMDPFTIAILSNDEALDINQDPLGKPAGRRAQVGETEVWSRPLADGTTAVGLTNNGTTATAVTANWSDLGLEGSQPVRDLWLHRNVGTYEDSYTVNVPAHGVVLLKIGTAKR